MLLPQRRKNLPSHLEPWQRAMTIANSCEALYINHQIRYNNKLDNFGPRKLTDRLLAHIADNKRVLELNNHEPTSGRPEKFDVEATSSLSSIQKSSKKA
jgi:hypothetical protein